MTPNKRSGCFISSFVGLVLVLLAVILTVAVALIVYFAVNGKDVVCQCQTLLAPSNNNKDNNNNNNNTSTAGTFTQRCKQLAMEGRLDICSTCSTAAWDGGRKATTAKPETESPAPVPVTSFRLPQELAPRHYDVEIQPYMHFTDPADFYFRGKVRIIIQCNAVTDKITVHANRMLHVMPSEVKVFSLDPNEQNPPQMGLERDETRQFLIIKLNQSMQVGKYYGVEMKFSSPLAKDLKGLYYSSYKEGNRTFYLATTQFAPTDARKAFPCMDEPALRATFNVTLVRPRHLTSLSTMPVIDSSKTWKEDGIDYVADVYQQTPSMPTYLLAFVVCDFDFISGTTQRGIEFRTWSKPEDKNKTLLPLQVGMDSLSFFEDYFQLPYPLSKLDMIAVPDFIYGAMENWGLIVYKEIYMLYTPGVTTVETKERIALIVCHELAHQWLGNLVTPAWWDNIWVSEGFSSYMEYLAADHLFPDWKVFEKRFMLDHEFVLDRDSRTKSHPIHLPVQQPEKSRSLFSRITYKKGASLVRMMRHFMGADTFRRGMVNYFRTHAYGAATNEDLLDAMTEQAKSEGKNMDVKAVMGTWLLQMNFPLVTVSRDVRNLDVVHVSQQRYLTNSSEPEAGIFESPYGYRWTIPITLVSSKSPRFDQTDRDVQWLFHNETDKNIHLGRDVLPDAGDQDGWILANINHTGFYRVNYHLGNWRALTNQLKKDHEVISVINRAKLISDAWALFKSGHLSISTALMTLEYLYCETDYLPWYFTKKSIHYTRTVFLFSTTFGPFQRFLRNMTKKAYETHGLHNINSSHSDIRTSVLVSDLACNVGNMECVNDAHRLYTQWMDKPGSNPINRNIRRLVYCMAVQNGGWEEWKFALQMYNQTTSRAEKHYLLYAMTCSQKHWILNTLLYMPLEKDSPIPQGDLSNLISSIARNSVGRLLAWNFFKAHLSKFLYREKNFKSYVIGRFADISYTEYELTELSSILEGKTQIHGAVQRDVENAVQKVKRNMDWMEKNEPVIKKWLKEAGY